MLCTFSTLPAISFLSLPTSRPEICSKNPPPPFFFQRRDAHDFHKKTSIFISNVLTGYLYLERKISHTSSFSPCQALCSNILRKEFGRGGGGKEERAELKDPFLKISLT